MADPQQCYNRLRRSKKVAKVSLTTVIVGGGIAGLCTAWALAEQRQAVTLIEQGELPNPLAASVDQHRLIRYPYAEAVGYCRMVGAAYEAWEKLWMALGETHYVETGTLALSCYPGDWSDRSRHSLEQTGVAYDLIAPADLAQRYPFLAMDRVRWGLYVKQGGTLLADRIVAALVRYLPQRGVELRSNTPVQQVDVAARRVILQSGECIVADRLVIAAGAWLGKLLPQYAAQVTPFRQVVAYFEPPAQFAPAWAAAPGILDTGGDKEGYVVPPVAGSQLKFGAGIYNRPGDPDRERQTDTLEGQQILDLFKSRLIDFEHYRCVGAKSCYYSKTADHRFIVQEIGDRTWVVSACSGHGFKFGSVIGLRLAETLMGRRSASELIAWAAGAVE